MQRTRTILFVALATISLAGCGTVRNFATGDPEIYGGVQKDVQFIQTPQTAKGVCVNPMTLAFLAPADLCLSFVADTLTLPIAVCMRHSDRTGDDKVAGGTDVAHATDPRTSAASQALVLPTVDVGKRSDTTPSAAPQSSQPSLLSPSP
jgi:uncharacterized protein YceK